MPFLEHPNPFRLRQLATDTLQSLHRRTADTSQLPIIMAGPNSTLMAAFNDHSSHPDILHLAGLVSEAVLEVVFVALPGYLVAWTGMFDANSQKFVAELNTMVFTPCLIFTKLASQLKADKLADLAVIPIIFAAQTIISWCSAQLMAWAFGFRGNKKKRQRNFVIAMGVFGNSNSLPISLVLSLSRTIAGLHWDKIPGDNDNEVGARGILYLMIFQQLGQLLRWTWGYSVLLRPKEAYEDEDREDVGDERITEEGRYRDDPDAANKPTDSGFGSGSQTPVSSASSESVESDRREEEEEEDLLIPSTPVDTRHIQNSSPRSSRTGGRSGQGLEERARSTNHITTFPNFSQTSSHPSSPQTYTGWKAPFLRFRDYITLTYHHVASTLSTFFRNLFRRLPSPIQKTLTFIHYYNTRFWLAVWRQMNPPLWAMLAALIVASVPRLQHIFFTPGTLVNNAVSQLPALRDLLSNLKESLQTIPNARRARDDDDSVEAKRRRYVETQSRRALERKGIDPEDPAIVAAATGRKIGRDEVEGIEAVVQALGGAASLARPEDDMEE